MRKGGGKGGDRQREERETEGERWTEGGARYMKFLSLYSPGHSMVVLRSTARPDMLPIVPSNSAYPINGVPIL